VTLPGVCLFCCSEWNIAINNNQQTQWEDPLPVIVSKLRWNPVSGDITPPGTQGYREWLCCVANWDCEVKACEDQVDPAAIRWAPRRHHQAAVLDKKVYVMGGRARSLDDIAPEEAIGGIIGERNRFREISILMSDVWYSEDGGACCLLVVGLRVSWLTLRVVCVCACMCLRLYSAVSWYMVNPGCYVQQADLMYKGAGVPYGKCFSDNDCRRAKLGNAECIRGACVCKHWGPRERFGLVTFKDHLYVVGGVTHVQRQMCGQYSCGEQYRHVLNDVWRSADGIEWDVMTLDVRAKGCRVRRGWWRRTWSLMSLLCCCCFPLAVCFLLLIFSFFKGGWPARGDFGLAVGSGQLWIAGGRWVNSREFGNSKLLNDIWSSQDGATWELNTTSAPWEPRCMHSMEFNENQLVIIGGMTRVPDPPPPPVLTPAEKAEAAALNAPNERTTDTSATVAVVNGETVNFELINNLRLVMTEDVWTWDIVTGGAEWVLDFDNHTDTMYYIRPESKLWSLRVMDLDTQLALEGIGITELSHIANTDPDRVRWQRAVWRAANCLLFFVCFSCVAFLSFPDKRGTGSGTRLLQLLRLGHCHIQEVQSG